MRITLSYHLLLIVFILMMGCETVVDIDIPEGESRLTVNALMGPGDPIQVTVHASKGTLEVGEIDEVTNATVTINGTDGISETVNKTTWDLSTNTNYYTFSFIPKSSVTYTLTAIAPGFEQVESRTTIPEVTPIIGVDTASEWVDGYRESRIDITFKDPAGLNDAYECKFYALIYEIDTAGGQLTYYPVVQELYAYLSGVGDFFNQETGELIFTDELFDGKTHTQRINYDYQLPFFESDTFSQDSFNIEDFVSTYLITELRTLTEDYYLFQTTYTKYQFSSGDPFAQPVQVYNNIDSGFGIFAGFNSSFDTLQVSKGLLPSPLDP